MVRAGGPRDRKSDNLAMVATAVAGVVSLASGDVLLASVSYRLLRVARPTCREL